MLYEDIQIDRKISPKLNIKTTEETDPEVPWTSELANEIVITTMSKDIKENMLLLHEKKISTEKYKLF